MSHWSKIQKWFGEMLDLPQDVILNLPRVTVIGQQQIYVENHRGIFLLTENKLGIWLTSGQMMIQGQQLVIRRITHQELLVEGQYIEWIRYKD